MGRGLGLSWPKPSLSPNPQPGLLFYEAWAPVSQAKALAFRPSRSRNITTNESDLFLLILNDSEIRKNLNMKQASYAVKKYKSHHCIPASIMMNINIINCAM